MRITRLQLSWFRNYEYVDITPVPGVNLFLGENGVGKSNLLEAIAFFGNFSSPRTSDTNVLVQANKPKCRIMATYLSNGQEEQIAVEIVVMPKRETRVLVNSIPSAQYKAHGHMKIIGFWPSDLEIVSDGQEKRRALIDEVTYQTDFTYSKTLYQYRHLLRQRNALLREISSGRADKNLLKYWDGKLIELASLVQYKRKATIHRLIEIFNEIIPQLDERLSKVSFVYRMNIVDSRALQDSIARDLALGYTTVGPHRDTVGIELDRQDVKDVASTGQKKTIALALRLSQMRLVRNISGDEPILVADDIFSDLDEAHKKTVTLAISAAEQAFISSIERPKWLKVDLSWKISNGRIYRE